MERTEYFFDVRQNSVVRRPHFLYNVGPSTFDLEHACRQKVSLVLSVTSFCGISETVPIFIVLWVIIIVIRHYEVGQGLIHRCHVMQYYNADKEGSQKWTFVPAGCCCRYLSGLVYAYMQERFVVVRGIGKSWKVDNKKCELRYP